jgi:hypothetical protein
MVAARDLASDDATCTYQLSTSLSITTYLRSYRNNPYINRLDDQYAPANNSADDLYSITLWSTAESALGIACGSVPGLKPLVIKLSDKIRTSSNTGSELSEIPVRFQTSDRSNFIARTRDSIVTVDGA